ncbi:DUF5672 family protein [Arcticibacter sp.]|jgi:hypothetical protein|uniref:DUF5672 family protein n=1 Tax=Arcticibacter sp. TaxID=1872630 RepID=UPI00388D916F
MHKNKVAITIPFYKETLSDFEEISLKRCFEVLGKYPIIIFKPASLDLSWLVSKNSHIRLLNFHDSYFSDIQGYNRLMLSEHFYHQFLEFEYILIYQLDAFVFKDELMYWCSKNFDYIGAPWLTDYKYPDIFKRMKEHILQIIHIYFNIKEKSNSLYPSLRQFRNSVGNGGFSLRRVKKFYDVCKNQKELIDYYNQNDHHFFNEDVFFSLEINRKIKHLRIPNYKLAAKFAVETFPQVGLQINNHDLPFGCHDWDRFSDFWRPHFKRAGYHI